MSKKGNDTPTSVRIRDNQRRSRNRRKELIDDLQARVKEYERNGVAATQQMQHAARYVALENTRLRTLLARHGLQQAEVDAYLRSCDENETSQGLATDTIAMPLHSQSRPSDSTPRCLASEAQRTNEPQTPNHRMDTNSYSRLHISDLGPHTLAANGPGIEPSAFSKSSRIPPANQTSGLRQISSGHASEAPECPNTSDCFCPPTITPPHPSVDNGLEISCETAASIIIEMRGEGDVDSIRASLGCAGRDSCTVRNSTVLQIMDEG